jgi:L-cysteine:1D-myo-inositol 2-amino-2-deoxy-alpha-D-glucopyranoside ligase
MRYLGPQIDIHSGGADLIFPHHSCEIAQSEHYSGVRPFVRYWFHIATVDLDGQKMSKSLGNMIFVHDLLKRYSPDAIRVYLLSHHYRTAWDANNAESALQKSEARVQRWRAAMRLTGVTGQDLNPLPYQEMFSLAMDDDLNTVGALEQLDELADTIMAQVPMEHGIQSAQATLGVLAGVLGLRLGVS